MTNETELKQIGIFLKSVRESQNVSLYRIEKETGLSFHTLKAIEKGSYGCSLDTLFSYIKAVGVSLTIKASGEESKECIFKKLELKNSSNEQKNNHD